MTPFCVWLGGGSHETLMLELLLGFTTVTVTALGGALGTERTRSGVRVSKDSFYQVHFVLISFNNLLRKVCADGN